MPIELYLPETPQGARDAAEYEQLLLIYEALRRLAGNISEAQEEQLKLLLVDNGTAFSFLPSFLLVDNGNAFTPFPQAAEVHRDFGIGAILGPATTPFSFSGGDALPLLLHLAEFVFDFGRNGASLTPLPSFEFVGIGANPSV